MSQDITLRIQGMSCASCAARLERVLNRQPGVSANVDYASERAVIKLSSDTNGEDIFSAIRKAGFDASDESEQTRFDKKNGVKLSATWELTLLALCTLPFLMMMVFSALGQPMAAAAGWLGLVIAGFVQFYLARSFYRRAISALKGGDANMDVLVVLSTTIAFGFSIWNFARGDIHHLYFESSVFIIFFVSLGKWLEARSKARAASELESLLNFQPPTVRVETDQGEMERPVDTLKIDDIFILRPGDSIAVDGEVISGQTEIDEALLTGEFHPVRREAGDNVFAGTINLNGMLRVRAIRVGSETVAAQMAEIVRTAQMSKARIAQQVDRVTRYFVPAIIMIAVVTFVVWFLSSHKIVESLLPAVSVLVIACPCALGLATPIVLMIARGKAAQAGMLFRKDSAFETAAATDIVVFDKTGTLTRGQFAITDVIPEDDVSLPELLTLFLAVEQHAEHPVARAIINYARSHNAVNQNVEAFEALPGRGVSAVINGDRILACSPDYMRQSDFAFPEKRVRALENQGKTVVALLRRERLAGLIALEDTIRSEASASVSKLHAAKVSTTLLTGDNASSAKRVSDALGIGAFYAGVLPDGKCDYLSSLTGEGRNVMMVGDGINDAAALAVAHTSIAMGSAAPVSSQSADIVLTRNDLLAVPDAISLSRKARRKIRSNLFLAFTYNVCAIPVAACGFLSPAIAAAAMVFSSLSVICNALELRRWRPLSNDGLQR